MAADGKNGFTGLFTGLISFLSLERTDRRGSDTNCSMVLFCRDEAGSNSSQREDVLKNALIRSHPHVL